MLLEKEAIGAALTTLQALAGHSFFQENHQKLFDLMVAFYDHDKPIDGVVIKDELVRRGQFETLGGWDFLGSLVNAVPNALRVRHYAEIVREKALLRQLIGATHRVMEAAFDDDRPAQELLDFAEKEIFEVTEKRVTGAALALPELITEVFQQLEKRDPGALTGEPTGFFELDELLCGLQPSELIIVAGRPSMGKTALGLNMAEHLAISEKRPALFFSLEMSHQQLAQRVLCSRARVNSKGLRRGHVKPVDLDRLKAVADELVGAPLLIDDSSQLSVLELRARARRAPRKHGRRAIYVDYLQLMHNPRAENRQNEVAEISRGLKALAKELRLPVVAMAQLNRSSEDRSRAGNRPRMSDLRESGAIEQDADVVLLLHRESYYARNDDPEARADNTAELIIAKQRNGPVGRVKLHFTPEWTRFDNHKPGETAPAYVPEYAANTDFP